MAKVFNVNGVCRPDRHYMVDLKPRLKEISIYYRRASGVLPSEKGLYAQF